jgi:hypothetical protein
MTFAVEGAKLRVNTLNMKGTALSLRGKGTVNLDGSDLNLDFNVDPGRLCDVLGPGGKVLRLWSDAVLKIKVHGKLSEPKFERELVPIVVEPVQGLLGGK